MCSLKGDINRPPNFLEHWLLSLSGLKGVFSLLNICASVIVPFLEVGFSNTKLN